MALQRGDVLCPCWESEKPCASAGRCGLRWQQAWQWLASSPSSALCVCGVKLYEVYLKLLFPKCSCIMGW